MMRLESAYLYDKIQEKTRLEKSFLIKERKKEHDS